MVLLVDHSCKLFLISERSVLSFHRFVSEQKITSHKEDGSSKFTVKISLSKSLIVIILVTHQLVHSGHREWATRVESE